MTGSPKRIIGGRYRLDKAIGGGGMATVHLARQVGAAGFARIVAVKRLHERYAHDHEFVAMFLDEARLVARVRHPNVVQTLDVVVDGGELFVVMEYVIGESLLRFLNAGRAGGQTLPIAVLASLMIGALRGLHAAHEARNDTGEPLHIVHRDISPHNLLVGVDGTTRVLDFGVATASQRIQTTQHGEIKGKLSYMAPEQLLSRPVDRRADIYAASVVMWEALSGARLFKAENDGAALKQILTDEPRLPSQLNPAIPLALEAAVMRGLERDADRRFSTAEEMALAIEAAVRVASNTDVGHLVATWCRPSLAERERIIAAIEAHQSAPSRRVAVETLESLAPKEPRPPSSPDLLLREPALAAEPGDEVTRSLATPLAPQLPEPGSEPTRGVEHGRKRPALGAAAALVLVTRIPCTGPRSRRARWRDADSRV